MAPVKLAAPIPEGTVMVDVQPSTKPGMEGVQETAGKIAVERKLQDEVIIFFIILKRFYVLEKPSEVTVCFELLPDSRYTG